MTSTVSAAPEAGVLSAAFQTALARWNRDRLQPRLPSDDPLAALDAEHAMRRREVAFLEILRAEIAPAAAEAPRDPDAFVDWYADLRRTGPGQHDALFPWLAEEASLEDVRWYLRQEAAGEAGFDDLVAMTQVKMPEQAKLELAANYWDEMGRGNPKGMHGPMLGDLIARLDLKPEIETTCWESLALANAMTAMATNRAYAWHAVGALGAIELTAPDRSRAVADGLRRLGLSGKARRYFELHATLDLRHSADWNANAVLPLVREDPRRARAMAEGALIRLTAGRRCFDRYRRELWGEGRARSAA